MIGTIENTTRKYYSVTKANEVAKLLNADSDDWTYEAVHDPKGTGYSFITITDEDGEFVGHTF